MPRCLQPLEVSFPALASHMHDAEGCTALPVVKIRHSAIAGLLHGSWNTKTEGQQVLIVWPADIKHLLSRPNALSIVHWQADQLLIWKGRVVTGGGRNDDEDHILVSLIIACLPAVDINMVNTYWCRGHGSLVICTEKKEKTLSPQFFDYVYSEI